MMRAWPWLALLTLMACESTPEVVDSDTGMPLGTEADTEVDSDTEALSVCDYIDVNDWAVRCDGAVPERLIALTSTDGDPECPDIYRLGSISRVDASDAIAAAQCDDTCVYQRFQATMVLYCDTRGEFITYRPGGPGQDGDGAECPELIHGMTVAGVGWSESWEGYQEVFPCPGNTPPVLADMETAPLVWIASDGLRPVSSTLTVTDADDSELTGATVRISAGFQAGVDRLALTSRPPNLTGSFDSRTGTFTLTGTAELAVYQNAVRSVGFESGPDATGERTLTLQVTDGGSMSAAVTRSVQVNPL